MEDIVRSAYEVRPIVDFPPESNSGEVHRFSDELHCAVYLYPDPQTESFQPIMKCDSEEGQRLIPLDAANLDLLRTSMVINSRSPREFPFVTESLIRYLRRVIKDGSLKKDWEQTIWRLGECPLWSVSEISHPEQQNLRKLRGDQS